MYSSKFMVSFSANILYKSNVLYVVSSVFNVILVDLLFWIIGIQLLIFLLVVICLEHCFFFILIIRIISKTMLLLSVYLFGSWILCWVSCCIVGGETRSVMFCLVPMVTGIFLRRIGNVVFVEGYIVR